MTCQDLLDFLLFFSYIPESEYIWGGKDMLLKP